MVNTDASFLPLLSGLKVLLFRDNHCYQFNIDSSKTNISCISPFSKQTSSNVAQPERGRTLPWLVHSLSATTSFLCSPYSSNPWKVVFNYCLQFLFSSPLINSLKSPFHATFKLCGAITAWAPPPFPYLGQFEEHSQFQSYIWSGLMHKLRLLYSPACPAPASFLPLPQAFIPRALPKKLPGY